MRIAKDLRKVNEYIRHVQRGNPDAWPFAPGGCELKMCLEQGTIEVNKISTEFLGEQRLFTGTAINYASRIGSAGSGNRCLLGPTVRENWPYAWISERRIVKGKHAGSEYEYYEFDLAGIFED